MVMAYLMHRIAMAQLGKLVLLDLLGHKDRLVKMVLQAQLVLRVL
jgi:hypothetical protein